MKTRKPIERRSRLKPISEKHAAKPRKARKPVKKRNAKRRASEFARCYHSAERVAFVKSLPCAACRHQGAYNPIVNAHAHGDGAGRKASYQTIVPLCWTCHSIQHSSGNEALERLRGFSFDESAKYTEAKWQAFQQSAA